MLRVLRLAAVAAILVSAAAAQAAAEPGERLTLTGMTAPAAHDEILAEARDLCRRDYYPRIHSLQDLQTCVRATTDDAVRQSARSDLIAYHEALTDQERYRLTPSATTLASAD